MNPRKTVVAFGLILGLCATVQGSGRVVVRSTYYPPVVPVYAAQYVPIPLVVPQYSVGTQLDLTPLIEELKLLRATVQQLRQGGELADLPPEPEYVGLVRQNCASCHGIQPKGNKLSFFDQSGRFKEPTPEVLGAMIQAVASGSMPKGGKMLPEDRLKLIGGLTAAPEKASMPPAK